MRVLLLIFIFVSVEGQTPENYEELHELFFAWRTFENPPLLKGAPDIQDVNSKNANGHLIHFKNS